MHAAQDGHDADWSVASRRWLLGRDGLCRDGRGDRLTDALVGPVVGDVGDVLREDAAQVALVEDEQVGPGTRGGRCPGTVCGSHSESCLMKRS